LLRDTSAILLDTEVPDQQRHEIQAAAEADLDNRVSELYLWRVGRYHLTAIVSVVTDQSRDPDSFDIAAVNQDMRSLDVSLGPFDRGRGIQRWPTSP
jgi:Co/Zn/Cd efflux system component